MEIETQDQVSDLSTFCPTCPQRSIDRAESQAFSDDADRQQSVIVSEGEDEDLNDLAFHNLTISPSKRIDISKQAPALQVFGPKRSRKTKPWAKKFPRDNSLKTFTGGHDRPRIASFEMPNIQHQSQSSYELENDWVCIPTEKHPETRKPFHHGKIRSFRNLFENSFRMSLLFDPDANERDFSMLGSTKFDGNNVVFFRQFEQSVLIRIINNQSLDFDEKFLGLLDFLDGSALAMAQVFTDELDAPNFVKALEALYYAYGDPTKLRDALLRQLMNEDPLDIRYPESFMNLSNLISQVVRAFGIDEADNESMLSVLIIQSVKMTSETALAFRTWLYSTMQKKNLKVLQEWLKWMHQHNISENLLSSAQDVKCPPITANLVHTKQQILLKGRCQLCFEKLHALESCDIYMTMTPNQRKIALTIYRGCFRCTRIVQAVHIGSNCNFCDRRDCGMPCEMCQSQEHHFSICEASDEPFKAVLKK